MTIGVPAEHRTGVRIRDGWHAPVGGVLLLVCSVIASSGLIAGASLATLASWVLYVEAERATPPGSPGFARMQRMARWSQPQLAGALLVGLSTLQGEFDFGVPQFRLLYHPILIVIAAGIGLVTARLRVGRGSAVTAAGFFILFRFGLALLIGGLADHELLQRESTGNAARLTAAAYSVLLAIAVVWVASMAWDLARLAGRDPDRRRDRRLHDPRDRRDVEAVELGLAHP